MQITVISQCEKGALARTRRILDAFAERIGDSTWQTIITQEGLDALHIELRKTASKSTAIACHWQRSRTRSQLLWVVGKRHSFNSSGNVPVNLTENETQQFMDKGKWKYLPLIKSLACLAGIFHDWGKSNKFFQEKLKKRKKFADPYRHEWLSALFLKTLYLNNKEKDAWLTQLESGDLQEKKHQRVLSDATKEDLFLGVESEALKWLLWLIVSHHRIPLQHENHLKDQSSSNRDDILCRIQPSWGYQSEHDSLTEKDFTKCSQFTPQLLSHSPEWLTDVKRYAKELKGCLFLLDEAIENGAIRFVVHHARLSLMLADYSYSSREDENAEWSSNIDLYANTTSNGEFKQHLDNHLYYVAKQAQKVAKELPNIEDQLLGLAVEKFKHPSPKKFEWQDIAVKKLSPKESSHKKGFFGLNLASTGCGKTIANAKIMAAIGKDDPNGIRFSVALGLRTLTLQTGDEYAKLLELKDNELATIIGSRSVQNLHKLPKTEQENENTGSESLNDSFTEEVIFSGDFNSELFSSVLDTDKSKKLLAAPALVCTIDHLMGATEAVRGGRYILPSLRLLSADLIIDEVDDFTGSDEIAIGRLIFHAAMLGKRVLLSSATIPPSMAEGYFRAYQEGWLIYAQCHEEASKEVHSLWVDEFKKPSFKEISNVNAYHQHHKIFTKKRAENLAQLPAKRKCNLIELSMKKGEERSDQIYFEKIAQEISRKHLHHHSQDPDTNITVSLGVIRVATIKTAVTLTQYLLNCELENGFELKVMAYHSRQLLLMRHEQEKYLDSILKRGEAESAFLADGNIRAHLNSAPSTTKQLSCVVIATPVEEVGRDHDFDWAIIEPSSFRSFIQMAGRVMRHRDHTPKEPNLALLEYNIKAYREADQGGIYFTRPGYEVPEFSLSSHSLSKIVNLPSLEKRLDATPRLLHSSDKESLIGVEHESIAYRLCLYEESTPVSLAGFVSASWWLTGMSQYYHPFRKSALSIILSRIYDAETEDCYFSEKLKGKFARLDDGKPVKQDKILKIIHKELDVKYPERVWLQRYYTQSLKEMAKSMSNSPERLSELYGEISVSQYERENITYYYNDQLGLFQ